jgi:Family of unknown function (DUF6186)
VSSRALTIAGYVAFLVAAGLLQVLALRPGSKIPTIGTAMRRLMRTRSGRVGVIAGWAWLGLHFFAR